MQLNYILHNSPVKAVGCPKYVCVCSGGSRIFFVGGLNSSEGVLKK